MTGAAIVSGGPAPAPGTLNELFFDAVTRFDKPDALMFKDEGIYRPVSHREILASVRHAALGLKTLGVAPGDRVAILSENRPEWAVADYARSEEHTSELQSQTNLVCRLLRE